MTSAQLALFAAAEGVDVDTARCPRARTKSEAGLAKAIEPGPQRLVGELVKRGLAREYVPAAAALAITLDEPRKGS